jgi:multidrug resistance efflux pump
MRFSRLVIGVLVIAGALWVIVSEQMAGASADAVLNAQIAEVRTPISGTMRDSDIGLGARVASGVALATVIDPVPDDMRLEDLILQRDLAHIRRKTLEARQEQLTAELESLKQRVDLYARLSRDDASARLAEARERLRLMAEAEDGYDPIDLSRAREEAVTLQTDLDGVEQGVFIRGGYNDGPHAEQKALEITSTLDAMAVELDGVTSEIAALTRRIDTERVRVGRQSAVALTSPVDGIVWERLAVNGAHVVRGATVLRLADCANTFVTLSVTQTVFNRLQPGATTTFRFDGSGEVLTGTVSRLAGTSASGFYGSLAVAPTQRHLERADVMLTLPDLQNYPELRCAIGRTGRAFFETRPLDWLRNLIQ